MTYWALDLELTGLDPSTDHIISVGMVPVRGGAVRLGERWHTLVRTGRVPTSGALQVHGIAPTAGAEVPTLREVLGEIHDRLDGAVLLVHNARIDVTFLEEAGRRTGRRTPRWPTADTLVLGNRLDRRRRIYGAARLPNGDLAGLRAAVGLPPHREHAALDDAIATAELFLVLCERLGVQRLRDLL